jgi:hypothetical protein
MIVVACDKCRKNTNINSVVVGIKITYHEKYDVEKEKMIRGEIKSMEIISPELVKSNVGKFEESCHICIPCKTEIETKNYSTKKLKKGELNG